MKKAIVALALVVSTVGAFAQTAPKAKAAHTTAKSDTTKKAKAVKKVSKKKEAKKM